MIKVKSIFTKLKTRGKPGGCYLLAASSSARCAEERGASILEVLLSLAVIALLTPFLYGQISNATNEIRNIAFAKKIIKLREPALNFVRMNQDTWPQIAQIKLSADELKTISDLATSGFIDKYMIRGATITDVYLTFKFDDALQSANVAKNIGSDGAIVADDGTAYGAAWAANAPDFHAGDLVYRISYDFTGDDKSKYLHRATSGTDDFTTMLRNLNMGKFDIYNIGTIAAESAKMTEGAAAFIESPDATATNVFFSNGANMDGAAAKIGAIKVTGDVTGFRNITTKNLNNGGFVGTGSIIADRATINNSVNVGKNMTLKSDANRTISGFVGIRTHSLTTSFLHADELTFNNNFGLTVSGELLMSTTVPIKIGNWIFPSTTPPRFNMFELSRGRTPAMPAKNEFDKIIEAGWKDVPRAQ